jgi:hypothetical protein
MPLIESSYCFLINTVSGGKSFAQEGVGSVAASNAKLVTTKLK